MVRLARTLATSPNTTVKEFKPTIPDHEVELNHENSKRLVKMAEYGLHAQRNVSHKICHKLRSLGAEAPSTLLSNNLGLLEHELLQRLPNVFYRANLLHVLTN